MPMIKIVHPGQIAGQVHAPASKSYAQRALAAALLAKGTTILRNPSRCDDAKAAMKVIGQLGAEFEDFTDRLIVHGSLAPSSDVLNFGEAGLGIRLFASIAALHVEAITLTGAGSLMKRPMALIEEAMTGIGVDCQTNQGFLPVRVHGPIAGGEFHIDGSLSSQVLTGLLIALPLAKKNSVIHVNNLKSIPYIDMTLDVMERFCIRISHDQYKTFTIPGKQYYHPTEFTIEGDWSGAAFMLVAGALAGEVSIQGLDSESPQADRAIVQALKYCGAHVEIESSTITSKKNQLIGFEFDATHCPDLFPPLAALAAHCQGTSRIKGVHRLIHKESNRANALTKEFGNLGVDIRVSGDELVIQGPCEIKNEVVDSHNDHRMAMAATVIALPGQHSIRIKGAECINKSYPEFFDDMQKIGGHIHE